MPVNTALTVSAITTATAVRASHDRDSQCQIVLRLRDLETPTARRQYAECVQRLEKSPFADMPADTVQVLAWAFLGLWIVISVGFNRSLDPGDNLMEKFFYWLVSILIGGVTALLLFGMVRLITWFSGLLLGNGL